MALSKRSIGLCFCYCVYRIHIIYHSLRGYFSKKKRFQIHDQTHLSVYMIKTEKKTSKRVVFCALAWLQIQSKNLYLLEIAILIRLYHIF